MNKKNRRRYMTKVNRRKRRRQSGVHKPTTSNE